MSPTRSIGPDDRDYPDEMRLLPGSLRHATLYVRGQLPKAPGIAVVGTRRPSDGARDMAGELVRAAAAEGFAIWSGGAEGIDAAAHRAALKCRATTVVVTAGGLDDPFPEKHAPLYRRVLELGGALVSLEDDGAERFRFQFPRRNYVLVALTLATLVVQARDSGGTRMSAHVARRLRRPLLVVPDAPWSTLGRGSALELTLGATPVAGADTLTPILRALVSRWRAGNQLDLFTPRPVAPTPKGRALDDLEPDERTVLGGLSDDPLHPDRLCDVTGLSYKSVAQALLVLALEGAVLEGPTGHFRRALY